jgi:hypothetical protein
MKRTTQAGKKRKASSIASTKAAKPAIKASGKQKTASKGGKKAKESKPAKKPAAVKKPIRAGSAVKHVMKRFFIKANGGLVAYKLVKDPAALLPVLVADPQRKPLVLPVRRMEAVQMLQQGDELLDGDVITLDDSNPTSVEIVLDDPANENACATVTPTTDGGEVDYEIEVDISELECFEEYYDEEASEDETTWYFGDDDTTIGIEG